MCVYVCMYIICMCVGVYISSLPIANDSQFAVRDRTCMSKQNTYTGSSTALGLPRPLILLVSDWSPFSHAQLQYAQAHTHTHMHQ